jgi:flagellar protein FlaG
MNIPALGASNSTTASPGASTPAGTLPPAAEAPAKAAAKAPVSPDQLKQSVDQINKFLKSNSEVLFSIDEASGFSVVKVVDTETNKVLRQFPSEQALEIGKNLQSFKGLLVDSKA